jgi:hypothetical protein
VKFVRWPVEPLRRAARGRDERLMLSAAAWGFRRRLQALADARCATG